MDYNEKIDKLKDLKIEEFVWIIYIGIIIFSFYSNSLERKYILYNDMKSKEKYRVTLIIIFSILCIIYYYFLKDSYESVQELNIFDTLNKKNLTYLSFLASLLIFISGVIFLYIAFSDESLDVEIAFN
ncbi:MAG: hypothetical protein IKN63_01295 [Bacilli bacterium]|nr:hypothetical protein [Bacilli bacterium]